MKTNKNYHETSPAEAEAGFLKIEQPKEPSIYPFENLLNEYDERNENKGFIERQNTHERL